MSYDEHVFFVLRGLHDGERGVLGQDSDGGILRDGWYFCLEDDGQRGPFASRDEARACARSYYSDEIVIFGHRFLRLSSSDSMEWPDTSAGARICTLGDRTLIWDPEILSVHEYLHSETSRVDFRVWGLTSGEI